MKIKSDFVTNSSSTNYLVFIPDNFDITKFYHLIDNYDIEHIISEGRFCMNPISTKEELLKIIKQDFETLMLLGCLGQGRETYSIIYDIIEKLDLEVGDYSAGSGNGGSSLINVNAPETKKAIRVISSGGWGITHGGWGHESKS